MPSTRFSAARASGSSAFRNEIEGEAVLSTHAMRGEAVDAGREGARRRQTEHAIHNSDGSIGERNSYGSDRGDVPG
jgi:hypothetical protein